MAYKPKCDTGKFNRLRSIALSILCTCFEFLSQLIPLLRPATVRPIAHPNRPKSHCSALFSLREKNKSSIVNTETRSTTNKTKKARTKHKHSLENTLSHKRKSFASSWKVCVFVCERAACVRVCVCLCTRKVCPA